MLSSLFFSEYERRICSHAKPKISNCAYPPFSNVEVCFTKKSKTSLRHDRNIVALISFLREHSPLRVQLHLKRQTMLKSNPPKKATVVPGNIRRWIHDLLSETSSFGPSTSKGLFFWSLFAGVLIISLQMENKLN